MFSRQEGPAERVVVHLGDSSVTQAELEAALRDDPVEALRQVIVIDQNGRVGQVLAPVP